MKKAPQLTAIQLRSHQNFYHEVLPLQAGRHRYCYLYPRRPNQPRFTSDALACCFPCSFPWRDQLYGVIRWARRRRGVGWTATGNALDCSDLHRHRHPGLLHCRAGASFTRGEDLGILAFARCIHVRFRARQRWPRPAARSER